MSTEKYIAGAVASYTTVMSTELNSLASGNALLGSTQLDNSSAGDMFADFSLKLASAAFVAPNFVALFLYPLHDDASTYGDGRFTSAAAMTAATAPTPYWVGNFALVAATQAQYAEIIGVPLIFGAMKPVLWNQGGVNFGASLNTLKWKTYNRQNA